VLNYAFYQNPKNYEGNNERTTKETTNAQRREHEGNNKYNELNESKRIKELKEKEDTVGQPDPIPYSEIINYLNEKANRKYKASSKKTKEHISARWNEGFKVDDFKHVIDVKCDEWLDNKDFSKFLRPETLFGTKMESYWNQPKPKYNPIKERDKRNIEGAKDLFPNGRPD